VLGVPCNTTLRDLEAVPPAYQGRGRRPKAPWQSVTAWRQSLDPTAWRRFTVRDGEKGPVAIEMVKRRVQTRIEHKRTGPEEWLVVTRRPVADERTLEAGPALANGRLSEDSDNRPFASGGPIGVVKAERDEHEADVVVASVQTLSRPKRLARMTPDFNTIVIDEAHHAPAASYRRILHYCQAGSFHEPLVLGVTATPERGDCQSLRAVFDRLVCQKSLIEMMQAGYLVDLRATQVLLQANFDALQVRRGDFVEAELEAMLLEVNAPAQVLAAFETQAPERKALLFTPTVATAYAMAETFCGAGIPAEALDGRTPLDERRAILRRFERGETRVVANCAVLTEGFDEPSVDCIVMARPTRSPSLYQQMLGRGTRLFPGKSDCLILDVVGVSTRHTLQTAAGLFDCDADTLAHQPVTEILAERERQVQAREEAIKGTLRATPVDLFARRALKWIQTRQGSWVLSLGSVHGTLRLRPDGEATWTVMQLRREAEPVVVAEHLPLAYAQGLAEDMARHLGVERLVDAEAPWRQQAAS